MIKLSVEEFKELYPENWDYVSETENAIFIYLSELDECPYIGIEYENGEVWVYGNKADKEVTCCELEFYLSQVN